MSSFDPSAIRNAVAQFTPRRHQKFQELAAAKDVIIELRQRGASYREIAELLTQHCLLVSKTTISAYCHEVLKDRVRSKRRAPVRNLSVSPEPVLALNSTVTSGLSPGPEATIAQKLAQTAMSQPKEPRPRGPRIARVRMLNNPNS